jgi:hypothetical protein
MGPKINWSVIQGIGIEEFKKEREIRRLGLSPVSLHATILRNPKRYRFATFADYSMAIAPISTELWKRQVQIGTSVLRNTNNSVEMQCRKLI